MQPGYYIEAEYADGFVHREDEHDTSAYVAGRNVFYDILHRLPEAEHGATIRFSLNTPGERIDIDFRMLPDNARPIRFKHMDRRAINGEWIEDPQLRGIDFGYQYTDPNDGKNYQHVEEIR